MEEFTKDKKTLSEIEQEIIRIARGMLCDEIDPIFLGSHKLSLYRFQTDDLLQDEILVFVGIASQTEEFPLNAEQRELWSDEALLRLDEEREDFILQTKNLIRSTCKSILDELLSVT